MRWASCFACLLVAACFAMAGCEDHDYESQYSSCTWVRAPEGNGPGSGFVIHDQRWKVLDDSPQPFSSEIRLADQRHLDDSNLR
jgi:hypothetical protein